jgi:hypothetical protein
LYISAYCRKSLATLTGGHRYLAIYNWGWEPEDQPPDVSAVAVILPACRAVSLDSVYNCAYNRSVNYKWDRWKAKANLLKHGVSFADAVTVFSDGAARRQKTMTPMNKDL